MLGACDRVHSLTPAFLPEALTPGDSTCPSLEQHQYLHSRHLAAQQVKVLARLRAILHVNGDHSAQHMSQHKSLRMAAFVSTDWPLAARNSG